MEMMNRSSKGLCALVICAAFGCGSGASDADTGGPDTTAGKDTRSARPGTLDSTSSNSGNSLDYDGESNVGNCVVHSADTSRYATVGFWKTSDCSGDPVQTNAFPINGTAGCYCWPGNSGENSADGFVCDAAAQTVTIVQYNSLTCGADDDTPSSKTFHAGKCQQDIPPTLYARVIDMGPCTP